MRKLLLVITAPVDVVALLVGLALAVAFPSAALDWARFWEAVLPDWDWYNE